MKKTLFTTLLLALTSLTASAQRFTDKLDRGAVAVHSSSGNLVTWRQLPNEYYGVKYNVYRGTTKVAENLTTTSFFDKGGSNNTQIYFVLPVINGKQVGSAGSTLDARGKTWANGYLDITLADVQDRDGTDVTANYSPNDAVMADLDGDGQLEIIIKRLNTIDASDSGTQAVDEEGNLVYQTDEHGNYVLDENQEKIPVLDGGVYSEFSRQFVVIDAYDVDWMNGKATLLWRIDCGPNMVSLNSTEIDVIAYDWDEDGKAEVVLRGADDMVIHKKDNSTQTIGIEGFNFRSSPKFNHKSGWQYAWSHFGREYLIYMNGETGEPYQIMDFPLPRLEESEWNKLGVSNVAYNDYVALEKAGYGKYFDDNGKKKSGVHYDAWGDNYGHRSSKYFFGAPFLDGRKASLFLGRGIYTRHKMIAMDLDRATHQWTERWRWACNNSSSPWYGNGYHNFVVADVDHDGRDEIVYGSMVIDDNGHGLSTTGYQHGDAQHVGDFDPYRKGQEFFGCLEDGPYFGFNYRNATTGEVYYKYNASGDDGRAVMANFTNKYPGSVGRSTGPDIISSVTDKPCLTASSDNNSALYWSHLNFRIYWNGDLCSEILDSPGTAKAPAIWSYDNGRLTTMGGNMNNDSKNNPCYQGDIIGDWREEIIVRYGTNLRVYTSGYLTDYSFPTLWNDHQYRQAMVWQMMAYNQPPHLSYFLGELEGITVAPPTLTNDGRTEIANGGTISAGSTTPVMLCETNDMSVSVAEGASPEVVFVNAPTWVQGTDDNGTSATKVKTTNGTVGVSDLPEIDTTTYTHTLTGAPFTGDTRLTKQGDGILVLPNVTQTYSGNTDVWDGTLRFDGTMQSSPVWLNRFATLVSNGGRFLGGITADYGARIVPGGEGVLGSLTTNALTLNFGARMVLDFDALNFITDQINATTLTIGTKTDDVWKNYGPKYLQPVIEIVSPGGAVPDGTYTLGTIGSVTGSLSDIVIEAPEGTAACQLMLTDGQLQLKVGTGVTTTCTEATITVTDNPADGWPTVSITPNSFSFQGANVVPTLAATFTSKAGDSKKLDIFRTIFKQDFEGSTTANDFWKNSGNSIFSPTYEGSEGHCIAIKGASNGGNYTPIDADYAELTSYNIEFDAYFANAPRYSDLAVMSKSHLATWSYGAGYDHTSTSTVEHNPYLFFIRREVASSNVSFTINETSSTVKLDDATWYHFMLKVNVSTGTVDYSIAKKGADLTIATGSYTLPEGESPECDGIYLRNGGYNADFGGVGLDNISIYPSDAYTYTFTQAGTLSVTSTYPGCKSATATYVCTAGAAISGDVNGDGLVNITDVTMLISYIMGSTPTGFNTSAADVDGSGAVNFADVQRIISILLNSK